MDMRELKGLEIAARARIVFEAGAWDVPAQSQPGSYRVTLNPDACPCDDFGLTQTACKHIFAARIVRERVGGAAAGILVDAPPKKPTYKQDWPRYNEAQQTEKHRFRSLLFELCQGIIFTPPGQGRKGRPSTPMADRVYASALKVYTGASCRRFACDLKDAADRGFLSVRMNSMSVCAYLEGTDMTPILQNLIVRSSLPLKAVEKTFVPDSTGFSTSRFVRWFDQKYGVQRSSHDWVKTHIMCGVKTNIVTAVEIHGRDAGDCPQFQPLLETTARNFTIHEVPADKAYVSKENLEQVAQLGATAYIPFKSNNIAGEAGTVWERMFHYYHYRREEFLQHYHQRSNVESTFAMMKAKFRDHVRSRTDVAMKNEVLCKILCHNICVVHQSHIELGIEPEFPTTKPKPKLKPTLKSDPAD